MAGFLYFVPGATAVNAAALADLDIGGLEPAHYRQGVIDRGPDPERPSGVLLAASGKEPVLAYVPGEQTWFPGPEKKYWLGIVTDAPPGPADLARKLQIPGQDVTLDDGNAWHVPVARRFIMDEGALFFAVAAGMPQVHGLDDAGEVTMEVARRAKPLWDAASEYWSKFYGGTDEKPAEGLTVTEQFGIACVALASNYVIGPLEVRALKLASTDTVTEINDIMIDRDGLRLIVAAMGGDESSAEGNAGI